jgi:hemerythrin-like domain-containing protein
MKATTLLERQHRKVEAAFKKLESGRSEPGPILEELANDLAAHMAIEQDILYPRAKAVDPSLVLESFEEHALAEIGLRRLLATDPDDATFKAKVITLRELIQHHVEEEEEELFPKLEKALGEEKLKELGKQMAEVFAEAQQQGYPALIPKGRRTSADIAEKKVLSANHGAR